MNDTASSLLASRVIEHQAGACRLLVLPTPADSVVSWRGSFRANPDFAAGDEIRQGVAVALLDKGTRRRDRFALARVFEERGIEMRLSSDGLHIDVSGRALPEHLPVALEMLAEMLAEPLFDEEEFEKTRVQIAAMLQRQMEDTGAQASDALARRLYAPGHPNYAPTPEVLTQQLQALALDDVRRYHVRHVGATHLLLAVAGDVDPDAVAGAVEEHLGAWTPHEAAPAHRTDAGDTEAGQTAVPMPDRDNVDVQMGHALSVRRDDDDYLPLYIGNYVLGGNFSARLMAVIRDEKGLTYGIGSGLRGITTEYDGHWEVDVTLSRDRLDEGLEATREEVRRFVEDGITEDELAEKKTTITGSYKVGLATTGRLARTLLSNAERGFPVDCLDRFPSLIEALTLEEVNAAIRTHLHPDRLHLALAGDVARGLGDGVTE